MICVIIKERISNMKNNRHSSKAHADNKFVTHKPINKNKVQHYTKSKTLVEKSSSKSHTSLTNSLRDQLMQYDSTTSVVSPEANSHNDNKTLQSNVSMSDIDYGLKFEISNKINSDEIGKPGSKKKRLLKLADEVEKKRKRMEEYQKQGEVGKELLSQEKWNDVLQSASGQKPLVNSSKIKKALKKLEAAKAKSSSEWRVRILVDNLFCHLNAVITFDFVIIRKD